jgi:hypothetical protein
MRVEEIEEPEETATTVNVRLLTLSASFSRSPGWQHRHPIHTEPRGARQDSETLDQEVCDVEEEKHQDTCSRKTNGILRKPPRS